MSFLRSLAGSTTVAYKPPPPPDNGSSQALNNAAQHLDKRIQAFSVADTAANVVTKRFYLLGALIDGNWVKANLQQVKNTHETMRDVHQRCLKTNEQGKNWHGEEELQALQNNNEQATKLVVRYAEIKRQETIVKLCTSKMITALISVAKHSRLKSVKFAGITADIFWKSTSRLTQYDKGTRAVEEVRQGVDQHLRDTSKSTPES